MESFHALYVIQTNLALKKTTETWWTLKNALKNCIILNDILKGTFLCKEEEQKDTFFFYWEEKKLAHEGKKTARIYYGSRNISFCRWDLISFPGTPNTSLEWW